MTGVSRVAGALVLAGLLAACATPPSLPTIAGQEALSGKLSVQVDPTADAPARLVSAAFDLRGSAERGELQLTSPLGNVLAQARWRPGEVVLQRNNGEQRYANLDALASDTFGEPLPLAALFDWLHGRPWGAAPSHRLSAPAQGFEQLGWTVALDRFTDGWVTAKRTAPPSVTVKAHLER
jgi:outer membrane lipoprotein LolB